ncbi:MAG: SpaH/EbpB family LPXTG-anchored major pilin [Lachnospiraceae bacterium]
MKKSRRISIALIAYIMMLAMCIPVYAVNDVGNEGSENMLYIHKIDQSTLEKYLTDKYGAGSYTASDTANTGAELDDNAVIGVWIDIKTETPHNVTVKDIKTYSGGDYGDVYLAKIPFTITRVTPQAGEEGSTDVNKYDTVTGADAYTSKGSTDSKGALQFSGLTDGYYRVTETTNSISTSTIDFIIALPYDPTGTGITSKIVHAYPKNTTKDAPVIEKAFTSEGINGNVISWKIKSEIPTTINSAMGDQVYQITDTIDSRLTLDKASIGIYYSGTSELVALKKDKHYSVSYTDDKFTITLLDDGYRELADVIADRLITDKNLYIEYNTIVTLTGNDLANLVKDPITNKAELDFTNDFEKTYNSSTTITENKFGGIKVMKQDGSDSSVKLKNVEFEVYTDINATNALYDKDDNPVVLKTDANGTASFYGLGAGTYYLKEDASTVPSGYKVLSSLQPAQITDEDAEKQSVVEITINNYFDNVFTLPTTGGTGTMLFTIVGIALIAVAGVVFLVSRRKKNESK